MRGRAATRSRTATTRGILRLDALHRLGKGVAQALDQLEQRQVDIAELAPEHVRPAALLQHALEIAEIFRRALFEEILA